MNINGTNHKQLTHSDIDIEGFRFSPDCKRVVLIKSIPCYGIIKQDPSDLPKTTGMVITSIDYCHWDHCVRTNTHPFMVDVTAEGTDAGVDVLEGEPYESPLAPSGGIEQTDWSRDSKFIAYACRKREGIQYAISTGADIRIYNVETRQTKNPCKPVDYVEPEIDTAKSMRNQAVNHQADDMNAGYDVNPRFSPDSKYIIQQSMKSNGYESDRSRPCVYELAAGKKTYATEGFDLNVDDYTWSLNSKGLYFIGVWYAAANVYQTNLKGEVKQLIKGSHNYVSIPLLGNKKLFAIRQSISQANEISVIAPAKKKKANIQTQLSFENKYIYDQLTLGDVKFCWVKTTDGREMMGWVTIPPHFDPNEKYPTLLLCEGRPQSLVSQLWSYRWNSQIMVVNGRVIIAPDHRGLPGFGSVWNEEASIGWTGQHMNDYLSAIDDAVNNLPSVDKDRLDAVGASFGGFSVYYFVGTHKKCFKCFISHDGAFNPESMYTDTGEAWFSNWGHDDAYWNEDKSEAAKRTYANSPHLNVDKWDTSILRAHDEKDYRISANRGMGVFNAVRLRGTLAGLLLYLDENHWILKPQNSVSWQRTFFNRPDR